MLVLSRKPRQRIRIGEDIVLTVVSVSGSQVQLGVEAPAHVSVVRDELSGATGRNGEASANPRAGPGRSPTSPSR